MAKIKLPFELQRPDANTPVANASEIDVTLNSQKKKLDEALTQIQTDLSGTKTKADSALQPSSTADAWPTDNVPVDNKVYNLGTVTTISVKNPTTSSNGIRIFFTAGTGGCVISSTDTLKWLGDTPASTLNAGKSYVIAILDGLFSITEIVTE